MWFAENTSDCKDSARLGALRVIAELQIKGYPNALLRQIVAGITQKQVQQARAWCQRYLRASKEKYGPGPSDPEQVRDDMWEIHLHNEMTWEMIRTQAARTK